MYIEIENDHALCLLWLSVCYGSLFAMALCIVAAYAEKLLSKIPLWITNIKVEVSQKYRGKATTMDLFQCVNFTHMITTKTTDSY